jgi:hypothetical protein
MEIAGFARGLLSLLGAKTRGIGLQQSSDFVQPTLDISKQMGANRRVNFTQNVGSLAAGTQAILIVPPGKTWRLILVSCELTTNAGGSFTTARLFITPGEGPSGFNFPVTAAQSGVASTTTVLSFVPPGELWLNSGTIVGVNLTTAVATVAMVAGCYYEEYEA